MSISIPGNGSDVPLELEVLFATEIASEKAETLNWKDIPGFDRYEISIDGRVRRKHGPILYRDPHQPGILRERFLDRRELSIHMVNGHRAVSIKVKGKVRKVYVDSLLKELFGVPKPT